MKIAFDLRCRSLPEKRDRGTGQDLPVLLRCLAQEADGDRVTVLLAESQIELDLPKEMEVIRLPWVYGDISRSDWFRESFRTGSFLNALGCDLYAAPDLYLPRGFEGPVVVYVHDCYDLPLVGPVTLFGQRYGWRWNTRFRWRYRWTWRSLRRAARIVANSATTAAQVARLHPNLERSIRTVPWGIDHDWLKSPRMPGGARRRWILEGPILLHVGGMESRKNPQGILDAFRRIRSVHPRATLLLAGPESSAHKETPGLRSVGFVSRDELRDLYDDADVLLFPSFEEGFGRPILEALARGCPVVTSTGTATEEVARPWTATGLAHLVDPHNSEAIAQAALQALSSPRPVPARPIRTFDEMARDLWSVYREATGR